jgi:hypothetical protein
MVHVSMHRSPLISGDGAVDRIAVVGFWQLAFRAELGGQVSCFR